MKLTTPADRARYIAIVEAATLPSEVTCEPWKEPRSDIQNNALWGCAYKALRNETGNDPKDLHEYFCGEYFGWVEKEVMGQRKRKPRRTTTHNEEGKKKKLTTIEFADFYSFIQQRSAENGYFVPDPDPFWRLAA